MQRNSSELVKAVEGCLPSLFARIGIVLALIITFLILGCIGLVVSSASTINPVLASVTAIVLVSGCLLSIFISNPKGKFRFNYLEQGTTAKPIMWYMPISILLFIAGFIQTMFWVYAPDNPIHEPRSVFILAVAGFIEYYRRQYEKTQAKA